MNAALEENDRPTLIIGKTVMGKGALKADGSSYEHSIKTHGAPLGDGAFANTIKNLDGDPENPFTIFDDVKELYENRRNDLVTIVAKRRAEEKQWAESNPDKKLVMDTWFAGQAP